MSNNASIVMTSLGTSPQGWTSLLPFPLSSSFPPFLTHYKSVLVCHCVKRKFDNNFLWFVAHVFVERKHCPQIWKGQQNMEDNVIATYNLQHFVKLTKNVQFDKQSSINKKLQDKEEVLKFGVEH